MRIISNYISHYLTYFELLVVFSTNYTNWQVVHWTSPYAFTCCGVSPIPLEQTSSMSGYALTNVSAMKSFTSPETKKRATTKYII